MKLSFNWLKDFVNLNDLTVEEVAHRLTMGAFEVEEITKVGPDIEGPVVMGEILEINPHPDADKIRLTKTIVEEGGEPLDIVCGAQNIEVGQRIPVALPGAKVLDRKTGKQFTIKASEIRGAKSNGMLCSPNELGIEGGDSEGILILDKKNYKVGEDAIESLALKPDWILNVEPRSNRGDALSVYGLAREVAAILELPLVNPFKNSSKIDSTAKNDDSNFKVEIDNLDDCPLFTIRVIEGIKVGASPSWLTRRLEAVGLRPVNNIVDITNYVMLETGQPLHAYDLDKLAGSIKVRRGKDADAITLIDGKKRDLNSEMLLITDEHNPLGVAGVMGGKDSEISDSTVNIALEAASFAPKRVRRASRLLGLTSDSSQRFERGVDIKNVVNASNRATSLILEHACLDDAKVYNLDSAGEESYEPARIKLRVSEIKRILDIDLDVSRLKEYLESLEFKVIDQGESELTCEIPSFRSGDVSREIDLVEEVARLYGYDNIEESMPEKTPAPPEIEKFEKKIRNALTGQGLSEAWISSLRPEEEEDENSVGVLNPLSSDHKVLRQSLIPGLLQSVKFNIDHGSENPWLFEIGRGYKKKQNNNGDNATGSDTGAIEYPLVACAITGSNLIQFNHGYMPKEGSSRKNETKMYESVDFYRIKGLAENLFLEAGIHPSKIKFEKQDHCPKYFHPYRNCTVTVASMSSDKSKKKREQLKAGWIAEIHPREIKKLGLKDPVFVMELDLNILETASAPTKFREPAQTPVIVRDLTADLDIAVNQGDVMREISKAAGKNLIEVHLVSVFDLSETVRSLSFRLCFQDKNETLKAEDVEKRLNKVRNTLTHQLQASFRA